VDDEGDGVGESHIPSYNRPPIRFNHEEEAAEALQQARAIAQRYVSQREFSLESELSSHPFHEAAQRNMNMYCIDVPVSPIPRHAWSFD
jgi:hypothetical protein